jgi:hypothetical protein
MVLHDDSTIDLFKKWKHVYVRRDDVDIYGWISVKFTKPAKCSKEPPPPGGWDVKPPK